MRRSIRSATSSSLGVLLLVGCWTSKPADVPVDRPPETPGEHADRVLRADAPLSLAYPGKPPPHRHGTTAALVRACRAHHQRSCWLLVQLATNEDAFELGIRTVVSECEQGDLWSCQAIPPLGRHPLVPDHLAGAYGRRLAGRPGELVEDDLAPLRAECRDGFAYSCKVLADRSPDAAERDELRLRTAITARAACARHVPDPCKLADAEWPVVERLAAFEWSCVVRRSACTEYGRALLEVGQLAEAHAQYERGCQYGGMPGLCLELVALYRDGTFREPVPGRAETLLRVICPGLNPTYYPECASFH